MNIISYLRQETKKVDEIKLNQHSLFTTFKVITVFLLIAILSGGYLIHSHIIFGGNGIDGGYDMTFHFQRIMDLTNAIRGGDYFPSLAFNGMSHNANAVMQLYPYLTLYPIAVLFLFIKPTITSLYIIYMALVFIAMLISYYSSISVSNNELISFTFAILYSTSSMVMFYAFEAIDIGALMAMIVLPISIFGYVRFIRNNDWIQLTLGMVLLIFSHVLTSLIVIVTLTIWTFFCLKAMYLSKWINLIKLITLTTLITAIWWLPSLELMIKNSLEYPNSFGLTGATDVVHIVTIGLHNSIDMSDMISFFAVIGLLLIVFFWQKFNRATKQMALVSVILLGLTTSILPWGEPGVASWIVLTNTPLAILQFPWRLDMLAELCLLYVFAYILVKFINFKKLVVPVVILLAVLFQFSNQIQLVKEANAKQVLPLTSTLFHHDKLRYTKTRYYINNNDQLKYILNSPTSVSTIYDYYPIASMPMNMFTSNSDGSYMGTRTVHFHSLDNGNYSFNIKPKAIYGLNLPIIEYNSLNYKTYLDGKPIKNFMGQDHLLVIPVLPHGNHHLQIKVVYPKIFKIAKLLSLTGIILMLFILIFTKIKSQLSKKRFKEGELS